MQGRDPTSAWRLHEFVRLMVIIHLKRETLLTQFHSLTFKQCGQFLIINTSYACLKTKEKVKWAVGLPKGTLHLEALMESLHTHTHTQEGDTLSLFHT